MTQDIDKYRRNLEQALDRLQPHIDSGKITGDGIGQFIVADKGDHGVEIYCGEKGTIVVIDPALGDELQGEIDFPSYEHALEAAILWLNGADRDSLLKHAL